MGELIERQAAIDAIVQCTNCGDEDTLRGYVLKHNLDNGWTGGILEALDAVKDLPPAQPEPQWIPVSERLPEDMQYVLLTVRRLNNAYNNEPFISVGYIGWNQHHWWCAHDGDCEISKVEVLAWMPLPKIYKPNNK